MAHGNGEVEIQRIPDVLVTLGTEMDELLVGKSMATETLKDGRTIGLGLATREGFSHTVIVVSPDSRATTRYDWSNTGTRQQVETVSPNPKGRGEIIKKRSRFVVHDLSVVQGLVRACKIKRQAND